MKNKPQTCRVCGCTENDCSQCIEKTGQPCHWVAKDLCSACVPLKIRAEYKGTLKDVAHYTDNIKLKGTILEGSSFELNGAKYPDLTFHLKVMDDDGQTQELSVLDETGNGWKLKFKPDMHLHIERVIKLPKAH